MPSTASTALSSSLPAAAPASVIRNRRSSTIPTPNVVPRRSVSTTNPSTASGSMRHQRLSHRPSAGQGTGPKRTSISLSPSAMTDDPRSSSPSRTNAAARAIVPKMIELMEQPTYDLSNTRIDTKHEAAELEKDMAALRAAILRLERDVKDTFTTRRVVTAAQAYFPDVTTPSPSAMGSISASQGLLGGIAAGASAAIAGDIGAGGPSSGDDMILRAKAELAKHKEKVVAEAEDKSKGKESHKRMVEEMIQATKKRFVENSNLTSAGPKHVHHFHGFFGDIMHIEIVGTSLVIVFTSRGFIEIWRQESLTSWKLGDYWHLAPHYPRVTVVTPLTPTSGELAHLMQNRIHYLKPPEELAPPKPETPPSPADDDDAAAEDEEEDDIAPLPPPSGLSVRSDPPPASATTAAAAFPMLSGRRGPAPPPKDELVQMLTSATYDMGGIVAVSDEQAVRRANYFAFLLAWAGSRSAATSAASMLGAAAAAAAAVPGPAPLTSGLGGSKVGSASALADAPAAAPVPIPVQSQTSQQQQQVIDRQLFLIGCANGEVSLLELTIDFGALVSSPTSPDSATPAAFSSSAPTRPVRFRILDRAMISVAPILHAVYFAPGHHAVIVAHSRDAAGHLVAELVGYALPRLKPAFRLPLMDVVTTARDMADDPDGGMGAPPMEEDPYTFGGGGWNGGAVAQALTVPPSAKGSGALGLTALVADNVQLRLYLGVKDLLVQVAFASLPLITEATFFNTEEGEDGAGGKRRGSSAVTSNDTMDGGGKRGGGGGDDEMLELVVVAAHSVRAKEADEDEIGDRASDLGSRSSLAAGSGGGGLGGLAGAVPEEMVEISSLCPITSPYTFKPYLLIGCTDASIRCVPLDDPAQEIFYYSSDIALRGVAAPMTVAALCPFRDAQLALAVCVDGTTSVLSIDRRELLNEHRMLMGRGGVRNAASAAAAASSGVVRQGLGGGGGGVGSKASVLPAIPISLVTNMPSSVNTDSPLDTRSALSTPGSPSSPGGRSTRAPSAAVHTRSGAGSARRQVYVGEPDQCLYAVAVGNEWALVKVTELVNWLDANPVGVGVGGVGVGTGPPLM